MTSRLLHSAAHPSLSFFADRTWGYRNAATETTNLHPSRKQSQHLAAANSWANWQPAANTTPNLINDVTMERGFETSTSSKQFFRAKDQHMWDLGPGGIAPLGDVLLQAGVGVAVPCTIALVIQPRWLHRADELFTWSPAPRSLRWWISVNLLRGFLKTGVILRANIPFRPHPSCLGEDQQRYWGI